VNQERFSRHPWNDVPSEWQIFGDNFSDYRSDFRVVDGDDVINKKLRELKSRGNTVMVDLMADTSALDQLDANGFRGRFLGVGLNDKREKEARISQEARNISFVNGDLNKSHTWKEIADWVGGSKIDLLMERGYGGLYFVPTYVHYQRAVMSRMWDMLNPDGGLMMLQTPTKDALEERGIAISAWQNQLNQKGIYNKFGKLAASKDYGQSYGLMILQKQSNILQLPDIMG